MYLKTPDTTSNIYNITIEEIDGYSSFFITKYIPTTYWLENKDQPYDGEIITYRESNTNSSGANTLQEYLDLINGELYAGGAGGGGSLSLTGTSSGTSWSSGLGGSPIYPQNCNGTVKTDYILEPHACVNGHMPGESCEFLNPSYPEYNPSNGPYYELTPYYTCVPNTTSGGNTSGSGDTSGGNTLGGGGSGSGTGTGSGGTNTGAVTGSITTIVEPIEEEKKTPCEELIENDSISDFNTKMAELKIKAGTQDFESAHAIYQNAVDGLNVGEEFTGQSNANGEGREVYLSLNSSITTNAINCVGFIHCHLDNGTTFKVFSLDDIIALALIANYSTRPTSELAIYVTTNSGTFALKVKNKVLLRSKIDVLRFSYNQQEEKFRELIKKNQTYSEQKLGLVKFINNMPLIGNPGIDLYEKVGNTWNQLNLSTNGNSITSTPCN